MTEDVDFLVIGSGLAGLTYALHAAPHGSVALLTKKNRADANSSWAQGGIAGAHPRPDPAGRPLQHGDRRDGPGDPLAGAGRRPLAQPHRPHRRLYGLGM